MTSKAPPIQKMMSTLEASKTGAERTEFPQFQYWTTRFEKLRIIINRMDATSYSVAKSTLLYYMYVMQDYTILKVIVLATVYCVLNF